MKRNHNYSSPNSRGTDNIFKVINSKIKVTDDTFQKCT